MRDLIVALIVFGSIPFILRKPFVGLLMWVWLGVMNPHKLSWGWASEMPFAQIVAITTLLSILFNKSKIYKFPNDRVAIALIIFFLWLGVSPLFSFFPDREFAMWLHPAKVIFMAMVGLILLGTRDQLQKLIWTLALSLGFFGIKGGIFTIVTGGNYRVWGPPGGAIQDNNTLALALVMTVPLIRYLQLHTENQWIKRGCVVAMLLCLVSVIGSQSRGAFLALAAMSLFLTLKSKQKGLIALLTLAALPIAWSLMPESWTARMSTIQTYDQDGSAMGRINAWWMAWNLAVDRFPIGGGFSIAAAEVFQRYAPDPTNVLVAHSIYFHVLGQHGFAGLFFYVMVFGLAWLNGGWVVRNTKHIPELAWARDLAAMCQVSLIGFAIGGAFLSLTYFDLPYYIVVILIVLRGLVKQSLPRQVPSMQGVPAT
jgi:probable O-glycosylation ligase (exosortase A-associated)